MTAYSKSSVHGRPARLGTETFTDNGTYVAIDFQNSQGKALDGFSSVVVNLPLGAKTITANGTYSASDDSLKGYSSLSVNVPPNVGEVSFLQNGEYLASDYKLQGFSKVTVATPYEELFSATGNITTLDLSITAARAKCFFGYDSLQSLVLRKGDQTLSTIQAALPTDLAQGTNLTIYVPETSVADYSALYSAYYTIKPLTEYGRYWYDIVTAATVLTSNLYVSVIQAFADTKDPYDGLRISANITSIYSGALTPITDPASTLKIYDLEFDGNIAAFSNTQLTSIDSNFANSACPIKKFRYGGTSLKQFTAQSPFYPFFYGCASIKEIYLTGMSVINCFSYGESFVYPNTVFEYISSNAASMNPYCFSGSTSLKKASLNAMASFAEFGFSGCTALVSVSAKSLTAIGIGAFDGCSALKSIPNQTSIASIGEKAFKDCSSLTQANLPLVTAIPNQCFLDCSKLVSCDTPLATSVGTYGFTRCVSLTSLSFPSMNSSSSSIGAGMINNCSSLATLYIGTSAMSSAPTLVGLSSDFSSSLLVHVPFAGTTGNMLATFWNSTNWASMTAYLVGDLVASVGDILAGTSAYGSTTYNCEWYSDERCTIQVNTTGLSFSVATAGTYYCKLWAQ